MIQGSLEHQIRRNTADGVIEAVEDGGHITPATLARLLTLLVEKTSYPHHVEVAIVVGPLLKTIDNETDARETIRRLEAK